MKVELKAYGRGKCLLAISDGIGKLTMAAEDEVEARLLRLLMHGELWAATLLLFAVRHATEAEKDALRPMLERVRPLWSNYVERGIAPESADA